MKSAPTAGLILLAAAFAALPAPAQTNQYPFQNPDLPVEERVDNIVSLMTLEEKVAFLSSRPGVPRLGIRAMGHVEGNGNRGFRPPRPFCFPARKSGSQKSAAHPRSPKWPRWPVRDAASGPPRCRPHCQCRRCSRAIRWDCAASVNSPFMSAYCQRIWPLLLSFSSVASSAK